MKLPTKLEPSQVVAVVDTREQNPWTLPPLQTVSGSLPTGDYTVRGLEHVVAVERKSLDDFLSCVGVQRERFGRELQRLLGYPARCVIVEASWADLERGEWRSQVTSSAAIGSTIAWIGSGIPFILAGDRGRADRFAARFLFTAARRHWRTLRTFAATVEEVER